MTSSLVSSVIATLLVAVVVGRNHTHDQLSHTTPHTPNVTVTTTTQQPKTFEQVYHDKICDNQRSCHLIGNVSGADRTLAVRNCMCDAECNVYGDCCFDSPFYNEEDQKTNFKHFYCPNEKWYLKASCSARFTDREIIRRCTDGVKGPSNDVRIITPITDVQQNVTYANVYCAMCDDRDPRLPSLRPWNVTFRCEVNVTAKSIPTENGTAIAATTSTRAPDDLEASMVARNLSWDDTLQEYRSYYRGRSYKCEPVRQPPADVGVSAGLRQCAPVIAGCPAVADAEFATNCAAFTLFVHDDSFSYRNVFCAMCNNVTSPLSGCRPSIEDRFSTPQQIFSGANKANGNSACSDPNVNPDLKRRFCRS